MEAMALQMQEKNALIASLRAKVDEKKEVCTFSTKALCKQRIEQVKAKFAMPADKRAMGYLTDLGLDVKELAARMGRILAATPGHETAEYSSSLADSNPKLGLPSSFSFNFAIKEAMRTSCSLIV